jgi:hypothetical protein
MRVTSTSRLSALNNVLSHCPVSCEIAENLLSMSQSNCHARSKQKRKKLRLKNRQRAVHLTRLAKLAKASEPKGKTIPAGMKAADVSVRINPKDIEEGRKFGDYFDHGHGLRLNQRQKRKRARAANRKLCRK